MFGVDIVTISKNQYTYNFTVVAKSEKAFVNYLYFHPKPNYLIVYIQTTIRDHVQSCVDKIVHATTLPTSAIITYYQYKPFVYGHYNRQRYFYSLLMGTLFALIGAAYTYRDIVNISHRMPSHPRSIHYTDVYSLKNTLCPTTDCIQRLGLFPDRWLIDVSEKPAYGHSCVALTESVYACAHR